MLVEDLIRKILFLFHPRKLLLLLLLIQILRKALTQRRSPWRMTSVFQGQKCLTQSHLTWRGVYRLNNPF